MNTNIRLAVDASIEESVVFELALMKLQLNKFNDMSPEKRESIDCFLKNIGVVDSLDTTNDEDLVEIAMHELKEEMCIKHDYIDTQVLVSSSNRCERSFSAAKCAFTNYLKLLETTASEHHFF